MHPTGRYAAYYINHYAQGYISALLKSILPNLIT